MELQRGLEHQRGLPQYHPLLNLVIEQFPTVEHPHGILLVLPTPRVIRNLIEEQRPLRYRMREGTLLEDLFRHMFLSGIHAVTREGMFLPNKKKIETRKWRPDRISLT